LNSTFVYLKWKPPPSGSRNGVVRYYRVIIKEANNSTKVVHNVTVSDNGESPGINLGGLRAHAAYWLQISAATSAGEGPLTSPAALRLPINMDPYSTLLDHQNSRSVFNESMHIEIKF
jgi:roundabout, axon guidance receptor 2